MLSRAKIIQVNKTDITVNRPTCQSSQLQTQPFSPVTPTDAVMWNFVPFGVVNC